MQQNGENRQRLVMPIDRTDIPQDLAVELQMDLEQDFERNPCWYVDDWRYAAWKNQQRQRQRELLEIKRQQVADAK